MVGSNALGFVDHSEYGALGVNLAFGRRPDGSIVHVSEVDSGLACGCVCPACGIDIVAHKGKRQHHFKHYSNSAGCTYGPETNAHYFAKRLLEREKWSTVPARFADDEDGVRHEVQPARRMDFDDVTAERREGRIVPDLIVTKDGHRLFIEIFVTHRCDREKIAHIRRLDTSAVEVDLSGFRTSLDDSAIADGLLKTAPRTWLHNRLAESDRTKLRLAKAQRDRAADGQADRDARRILQAIREAKVDAQQFQTDIDTVALLGRSDLIGVGADTAGFLVSTAAWQAMLLMDFVILPSNEGAASFSFNQESAINHMTDCVIPDLRDPLPTKVEARLLKLAPTLTLPSRAVGAYIAHLIASEVLEPSHPLNSQIVRVASAEKTELRRRIADYQAREKREEQAERRLEIILSRVEPDDLAKFDLAAWKDNLPGFDLSLSSLCARGDEWRRFSASLHEIEAMVKSGQTVRDLLGLPLEGLRTASLEALARKREEDVQRAKEARLAARTERAEYMRNLAHREMREEAEGWLNRPNVFGMTPLEAAAEGLSIDRLRDEIHERGDQRRERARQMRIADEHRARLRAAAMPRFDHDERHANLFLNSTQPALGGQSAMAYCRDQATFEQCMSLMARQARPRR
ncbi:MAG: hypothetical protein EON93_03745 [Burkholderiales bacterium]|nr:MAG: hypothetical protein EON93_03745 [Burkholderiales bacterium]